MTPFTDVAYQHFKRAMLPPSLPYSITTQKTTWIFTAMKMSHVLKFLS